MKNILYLASFLATLVSCNSQKRISDNSNHASIGGKKDAKGCFVSAGASWSELQKTCVQIFNVGERLNPLDVKDGDAVISAFVLFNEDKSKLELFLAEGDNIIMNKKDSNNYEDGIYRYNSTESTLYINNVKKYTKEK
jgi:hypothetical protein